jgi:hypothetical protein
MLQGVMLMVKDNRALVGGSEISEDTDSAFASSHRSSSLESWNGSIDLTPYKQADAWPGGAYCLLGNSFNVAIEGSASASHQKRINAIHSTFAKTKNSSRFLSIGEALANTSFSDILSRFERDWLGRLRADTLLGPAYNERGELIQVAFSVWRRDFLAHAKAFSNH